MCVCECDDRVLCVSAVCTVCVCECVHACVYVCVCVCMCVGVCYMHKG